MHFGAGKLAVEEISEPPCWFNESAANAARHGKIRLLKEGVPTVF